MPKQIQHAKQLSFVNFQQLIRPAKIAFPEYILLPDDDIDKYATRVNKLTIKLVNGKRTMFKDNLLLQTLTCQEATSQFFKYIQRCIESSKSETNNEDICTVLIGHNARRFDESRYCFVTVPQKFM